MNAAGTPWAGNDHGGARDRLRGVHRCDVAVIGAGLTGLACALELAERDPDRRVVVIEADRAGAGASGRGTGLLGPRVGPPLTVARRRLGDDVARAAHLWSIDAVRDAIALVERHRISCDLTPGGQLIVARDEQAAARQEQEAEAARALGLPVEFVPRGRLPPVARGYAGGLRYGTAATLDPAALTDQLARLAEQRGVTVFEHSAVRGIRRGLRTTVTTDDGAAVAEHVVVAAGAYGADLRAPAGVVALRVQAGVTGKLPDDVLGALEGLRTEPLIEHGELAPYFRLTADGRVVVGGGAVRRGPHGSTALVPGRLRAAVRGLAPELAAADIEAAWAGPVGMTRDGLSVLGRHPDDPRLLYASGCNGHGLAVSLHNGAHLARWIAGGEKDHLSFALPWMRSKAPWMPRGRLADGLLDRYLAHLTAAAGRP